MLRKKLPLVFFLLLWLCPGCWDYREVDQSSVPSAVGIDLDADQQIVFSTQLVLPLPHGEAASSTLEPAVVTARSPGVALAARRIMLSLSQVPEWAHVSSILLGENLVQSDLSLAADFMTRNRNLRPDINIMVASSASTEAILSSRLPQTSDLGLGIQDLIRLSESQLGIYTPMTAAEFTYRLSTPGVEPAVPQVTLVEENEAGRTAPGDGDKNAAQANNKTRLTLNGTAVFKGSKMAGSLNETESRGYRWLSSKHRQGGYFTIASPANPNETIGLEVRQYDSNTRVRFFNGQPVINIQASALLNLYDQSGTQALEFGQLEQIEVAAAREIKRQIMACIIKSQELNSDILGWGYLIYTDHPKEWEALESRWSEIYQTVPVDVEVKAAIQRQGLIIKNFPLQ